jgi:hypothetical protein
MAKTGQIPITGRGLLAFWKRRARFEVSDTRGIARVDIGQYSWERW